MRRTRRMARRPGHHLVTCDLSGWTCWDDEVREMWDGKIVYYKFWEPRHPQDFVRGSGDDQSVAPARPEPPDILYRDIYPNHVTYGDEEELTNTMIVGQSGRETIATQADDQYGFMQDADDLKAPRNYGGLLPAYFEDIKILSLYVNAANLVVLDFGQRHGIYHSITVRFDLDPSTDVTVGWDSATSTYIATDADTFAYLEVKKAQAKQHGKGTIVTFPDAFPPDCATCTLDISTSESTSCVYVAPDEECTVQAEYTYSTGDCTWMSPDTFLWELENEDAGVTILGSSTSSSVTIQSIGSEGTYEFDLTLTMSNSTTECAGTATVTGFSHTHSSYIELSGVLVSGDAAIAGVLANELIIYMSGNMQSGDAVIVGEILKEGECILDEVLDLPLLDDRYNDIDTNHAILSRSSTAVVQQYTGEYATAEVDELRFQNTTRTDLDDGEDYGAGVLGVKYLEQYGASEGLMIYEEGDNYILNSEDMQPTDTTGWVYEHASAPTSDYAIAPNGQMTATLLSMGPQDASDNTRGVSVPGDTQFAPGTSRTVSVWIKESPNVSERVPYIYMWNQTGSWPASVSITVTPTSSWVRYDIPRASTSIARMRLGNISPPSGALDFAVEGEVLIWGGQINTGATVKPYFYTNGIVRIQELDDVICSWPTGVVNDFTVSLDWTPSYNQASTLLESGNFRLYYTGTEVRVSNGVDYATYSLIITPYTEYSIEVAFHSTDGISISVGSSAGTPSSDTTDIVPAVSDELQLGAKADLTEFINGTLKNILVSACD